MTTGRPGEDSCSSEWDRSEVIDIFNDNVKCQSFTDPPLDLKGSAGGLIKGNIPLVCGGIEWRCKDDEIEYIENHNACSVLGQNRSIEFDWDQYYRGLKSAVIGDKVCFLLIPK